MQNERSSRQSLHEGKIESYTDPRRHPRSLRRTRKSTNPIRISCDLLLQRVAGFSEQQEEKRRKMKAAKKARQRKRRASTRAKSQRKAIASADKSFGAAVSVAERKSYPHMEWDGSAFSPTKPKPPPTLNVNVTMMLEAHKKCGVHWKGSRKGAFQSHSVQTYADTCCQTCTAGVDFINQIGCPESYLVPTSHRIIGITASSLNIIGSVLLRIEVGGNVTRQMIHIS